MISHLLPTLGAGARSGRGTARRKTPSAWRSRAERNVAGAERDARPAAVVGARSRRPSLVGFVLVPVMARVSVHSHTSDVRSRARTEMPAVPSLALLALALLAARVVACGGVWRVSWRAARRSTSPTSRRRSVSRCSRRFSRASARLSRRASRATAGAYARRAASLTRDLTRDAASASRAAPAASGGGGGSGRSSPARRDGPSAPTLDRTDVCARLEGSRCPVRVRARFSRDPVTGRDALAAGSRARSLA